MLHTILKFLVSLFSALSRAEDASTSDPASTVDTKTSAPPGWEGDPLYRYLDVSRYQGKRVPRIDVAIALNPSAILFAATSSGMSSSKNSR